MAFTEGMEGEWGEDGEFYATAAPPRPRKRMTEEERMLGVFGDDDDDSDAGTRRAAAPEAEDSDSDDDGGGAGPSAQRSTRWRPRSGESDDDDDDDAFRSGYHAKNIRSASDGLNGGGDGFIPLSTRGRSGGVTFVSAQPPAPAEVADEDGAHSSEGDEEDERGEAAGWRDVGVDDASQRFMASLQQSGVYQPPVERPVVQTAPLPTAETSNSVELRRERPFSRSSGPAASSTAPVIAAPFEKHTKGFASKYMAKFGYTGGGIGVAGQGVDSHIVVTARPERQGLAYGGHETSLKKAPRLVEPEAGRRERERETAAEARIFSMRGEVGSSTRNGASRASSKGGRKAGYAAAAAVGSSTAAPAGVIDMRGQAAEEPAVVGRELEHNLNSLLAVAQAGVMNSNRRVVDAEAAVAALTREIQSRVEAADAATRLASVVDEVHEVIMTALQDVQAHVYGVPHEHEELELQTASTASTQRLACACVDLQCITRALTRVNTIVVRASSSVAAGKSAANGGVEHLSRDAASMLQEAHTSLLSCVQHVLVTCRWEPACSSGATAADAQQDLTAFTGVISHLRSLIPLLHAVDDDTGRSSAVSLRCVVAHALAKPLAHRLPDWHVDVHSKYMTLVVRLLSPTIVHVRVDEGVDSYAVTTAVPLPAAPDMTDILTLPVYTRLLACICNRLATHARTCDVQTAHAWCWAWATSDLLGSLHPRTLTTFTPCACPADAHTCASQHGCTGSITRVFTHLRARLFKFMPIIAASPVTAVSTLAPWRVLWGTRVFASFLADSFLPPFLAHCLSHATPAQVWRYDGPSTLLQDACAVHRLLPLTPVCLSLWLPALEFAAQAHVGSYAQFQAAWQHARVSLAPLASLACVQTTLRRLLLLLHSRLQRELSAAPQVEHAAPDFTPPSHASLLASMTATSAPGSSAARPAAPIQSEPTRSAQEALVALAAQAGLDMLPHGEHPGGGQVFKLGRDTLVTVLAGVPHVHAVGAGWKPHSITEVVDMAVRRRGGQ